MSTSNDPRKDRNRRNAENHFLKTEQRADLLRRDKEAAQAAETAKTAKLRALRLAKEASDKEASDKETALATNTKGTARKPA